MTHISIFMFIPVRPAIVFHDICFARIAFYANPITHVYSQEFRFLIISVSSVIWEQHQVFDSVVCFVTINMVYFLLFCEISANMLLHDQTMFCIILTFRNMGVVWTVDIPITTA
jgi:hypothetical protein